VVAALLVSCGSSTGKLIPTADAGPLQSDFEAVAHAAETGNGNCAATKAAITKTEGDFSALPASVDSGLRETLRNGIDNLSSHALALCAQPLVQTTTTNTTAKTTTTTPPPTTTATTTTTTTPPPTSTVPTEEAETPGAGGGTVAPGSGEEPVAPGGGTGVGEGTPGSTEAPSEQEAGK
jgi:hypothetical protein